MIRCSAALLILFAGLVALTPRPLTHAQPPAVERTGTVVLAGGLPDPDLVALSVNTTVGLPDADFLMDTPRAEATLKLLLDRARPAKVIPVGAFPQDNDPTRRWGIIAPVVQPTVTDPVAYGWSLFPKAEKAVVAPRTPTAQLLHAACLAGTLRVPLFVLRDGADPIAGLKDLAASRGVKELLAVGPAIGPCKGLGVPVTELPDTAAVARLHRKELLRGGKIETLVLTNPDDPKGTPALAPLIVVRHRAALLTTRPDGADAGLVVLAALKDPDLATADNLIVAADFDAIPTQKRENPAQGKDEMIDVEPWLPAGDDPITLASGRIFHPDRAVVPLMLARKRLLENAPGPPKVLIASNPGDGLPLLETFSRNTARELSNAGYRVTAQFGAEQVTGPGLRAALPEHDIFLWEGHYRTLVDGFEMPKWTEPLRPSLIFLQSCLALNVDEGGLLFDRGAVALVGSPNRTYSGSGGSFTLAFFGSLAYDGRTVGGSIRHAKNFLLCYSELKAKRLGEDAKLGGANRRAAWVFSLWGDPTLRMPKPVPPADALPRLKTTSGTGAITLAIPQQRYPATEVPPYRSEMWPGGRLAGLLTADPDAGRRLVPLAFAEVHFPDAPAGQVPRVTSKVPGNSWVFRWDARRKVAYLLVIPRDRDGQELDFRIRWVAPG